MKRRSWVVGGAGLAAVAAGAGWFLHREQDSRDAEAFWVQSFEQPAGGQLVASTLRGRPLLLNFWATWCAPCVREMPMLDRFQRTPQGAALRVVGLAVDGPTPVREYLARLPMGFPIGLAGLGGIELARTLGNAGGGLPFTVVFDRRGRIHDRKLGGLTEADLERWVRTLGNSISKD